MKMESMYEQLGVSAAVYEYGERIIAELRDRFDAIDQTAEYNQAKVLSAMQKNRVNATHFAATTGYGYDDEGRDNLERVYADVFHTEAALVRPQITCGTHALTVALSANLLPGDELLSPVGAPYDTLEEVIGIRESKCSLKEYGVTYAQADLKADGTFDYDAIRSKHQRAHQAHHHPALQGLRHPPQLLRGANWGADSPSARRSSLTSRSWWTTATANLWSALSLLIWALIW